jgi:hypothetical protein
MTATPLSPGDLLSRYPHFGPYPATAFPPPTTKKKKWKLDTANFMSRSGKAPDVKNSATRSISTSAIPAIQRPAQQHRNASGTQYKRRPKIPGHAYTLNVGTALAGYQNELGGRYHHYGRLAREAYDWDEWRSGGHEINEKTRIVELKSGVPENKPKKSFKTRICRVNDAILTTDTSSASSSQLSIARKPISSSSWPGTPDFKHSTPTSLLELYLDKKANEHPAETERQVRAGAIVSEHCSPYSSPYQSRAVASSSSSHSHDGEEVTSARSSTMEQDTLSILQKRHHVLLDTSGFFGLLYDLIEDATRVENRENVKKTGTLIAKLLVVLYLASCAWNVLTAVRDAMFKAFEPILAVIGFLSWITGKSY